MVTRLRDNLWLMALFAVIFCWQIVDLTTNLIGLRNAGTATGIGDLQLREYQLLTRGSLTVHATLAAACLLAIIWLVARTAVGWRPRLSPEISSSTARELVVGRWLKSLMPESDGTQYRLQINDLVRVRVWAQGIGTFVITAVPYVALYLALGQRAIYSPVRLIYAVAPHRLFGLGLAVPVVILARRVLRRIKRRRLGERTRPADRALSMAIGFTAEAENWSTLERFKVCLAYSLALQVRFVVPIVPVFTLFTAMISHRLFMELYLRELARTGSRDKALSHVVTVRTARLASAGASYVIVLTVLILR